MVLALALFVGVSAFTLGACDHDHDYASVWSKDETHHWHECKVEDCEEASDKAEHTASDWIIDQQETYTVEGSKHKECTVCGYVMETDTMAKIPLSTWNGTVGVVPDAVNGVIEISTAEQLAAVAQYVNTYESENEFSYAGVTIKLVIDIDLNNLDWTPIGSMEEYPGGSGFSGIFDGSGHTIYNLKVSVTGEEAAGLFGGINSGSEVKNLTIKNVNITSNRWAGGIVGYAGDNNEKIKITNCRVEGGTITGATEFVEAEEKYDNGDKIGGIVGYICGAVDVDGCSVKNVTIKGYRDIGGIVGFANDGVSVKNNTIEENVVVTVDNTHNYKNYETSAEHDAGSIIGEKSSEVLEENNTGTATIN